MEFIEKVEKIQGGCIILRNICAFQSLVTIVLKWQAKL